VVILLISITPERRRKVNTFGTFGTFLLFVLGFFGVVLIIADPLRKTLNKMEGKTGEEVGQEFKSWLDKTPEEQVLGRGCALIGVYVLNLLYLFVIEPFAVIMAIVRQIGYQPLAYAMLVIVVLAWILFAVPFLKSKGNNNTKKMDEPMNLGLYSFRKTVLRTIYALPTVYMFYLVLVSLRIL
jgi:hypothetical protein